jgi:ATP/maltotriose-dependent transcriptional regulator MalT
VQRRLSEAARYQITVIVAPAGFGKTVSLRHFVGSRRSGALYEVPPETTALLGFVRGLCDSLSEIAPGLRSSLATAIGAAEHAITPVNELAAWVAAHMPSKPSLLAIDNLDECASVPQVAEFLAQLVELTKDRVCWLFASRGTLINLPFATWLAYSECDLPITSDDLRFTLDECRQIAAKCNVAVTEHELQRILAFTEGWPVAVCLALRYSVGNDRNDLTAQTREAVYAYLDQRVWQSLDLDTQSFLFQAAFLPNFNLSIISLAGFSASDRILYQINSQIGLVTKSEGSYKLYRLFRDFVREHLANQGHTKLAEARRAAGHILELTNSPIEALERYVDADAFERIDEMLTKLNFSLIERGHVDLVERALRMSNTASSPAALGLRAAIEESRGRLNSAELLYARALQQSPDGSHLKVSIAWRYSLLLYQQGRSDAIPLLKKLYSRPGLDDCDRADVGGSLAMLLALAGDHTRARITIDEALWISNAADDQLRARILGRASTVAFFAGDADRVERFATEAALIARDSGLYSLAARITTSLSSLHTSAGRIDLAASYARQVAENAEKAGDSQLRARGLRELLALEAEIGDEAAIVAIKAELSKISYDGPIGLIGLLVSRGMQLIWREDFEDAIELLSSQNTILSPHQNRIRISLLAVAAAGGSKSSLLPSVLEAYASATSDDWGDQPMFDRERALSLQYMALALLVAREPSKAREYSRRAAFLSAGPSPFAAALDAISVRSVCALRSALEALEARCQGGVAKVILSTTKGLLETEQALTDRLTPAEIAVLQAMGDGLSNKAIAALNGRTINTIRSQVSSVLQKLKCDSRGEAVATARRHGLL